MRDLVFPPPGDAPAVPNDDPVARARLHARRDLPSRFYSSATAAPAENGWAVLLDGKSIRTPARNALVLPTEPLAQAVAAEWAAQGERINPATMPLTRIANSVIDGIARDPDAVAAETSRYAASDLLCYRAEGPERLVDRQTELWDPVLDWAEDALGARFLVAEGISPLAQEPEALTKVAEIVRGLDPWRLAAVNVMTTVTGSVLLALAVARHGLSAEAAWRAAQVDENWNMELWGFDQEALRRIAHRRADFDAAARLLDLLA